MYNTLLTVHSYLRWVVTILAILVVVNALLGLINKSPFTNAHSKTGLFFMISADIQLLVGLILYAWLSPITTSAFSDFGMAIKTKEIRYWAVEHITAMILAWLLIHIGKVKTKNGEDAQKHRNALIYYGLAIIIVVATIPWASRPLLR